MVIYGLKGNDRDPPGLPEFYDDVVDILELCGVAGV